MTGLFFIGISIFAAILPGLGLLSPGESFDPRIAPVTGFIGIVFLIMGFVFNSKKAVPQPIQQPMQQMQPPQQIVRTLVICPNCRKRVAAESKFCPECGASLTPTET